jgi:DNA polymerase-3 subunit beta
MKTIITFEGQKNTIQGECKPKEAMEILGLDPKEWKVISKDITEKAAVYAIERRTPFYVVPKTEDTTAPQEEDNTMSAVDLPFGPDDHIEPITGPNEQPISGTVRVDRAALSECLNICCKITSARSLMPILANVLIQVSTPENDTALLRISATDLDLSWQKTIGATGDPLTICTHAGVLYSEIKALPAEVETVELSYSEEPANKSSMSGNLKFRSLSVNGRCTLFCADPEEFPEIAAIEQENFVSIGDLAKAIKAVIPAVSKDETRYSLTGVYIDPVNKIAAATDGYRLHSENINPDHAAPAVIIPLRTASLLLQYPLNETMATNEAKDRVVFIVSGGTLISRVIDGNFPDVKNVIPANTIRASFASEAMLKLIDGALPLSEQTGVLLTFNGGLEVRSESDAGHYKWNIPCTAEGLAGDSATFSFAPRFLIDALKSYPQETAIIEMPEEYGACLINGKAVIMPRRV